MRHYKYKIEHDFGLAPNPFGEFCTLAVCKSQIRSNKNLEIGSWIFGIGSKKLREYYQRLIFCMEVEEKLPLEQYWDDPRFQYKKVVENGSLQQLYGDNIYHIVNGEWVQEDSAHSKEDGITHEGHLETDIDGKYILISQNFYYFGRNAIDVPNEFKSVICTDVRNWEYAEPEDDIENFIQWLEEKGYRKRRLYGDPINWITEHGV
jgi:hypothetical protein